MLIRILRLRLFPTSPAHVIAPYSAPPVPLFLAPLFDLPPLPPQATHHTPIHSPTPSSPSPSFSLSSYSLFRGFPLHHILFFPLFLLFLLLILTLMEGLIFLSPNPIKQSHEIPRSKSLRTSVPLRNVLLCQYHVTLTDRQVMARVILFWMPPWCTKQPNL